MTIPNKTRPSFSPAFLPFLGQYPDGLPEPPPVPDGFDFWRYEGRNYYTDKPVMLCCISNGEDGWYGPRLERAIGVGAHYLRAVVRPPIIGGPAGLPLAPPLPPQYDAWVYHPKWRPDKELELYAFADGEAPDYIWSRGGDRNPDGSARHYLEPIDSKSIDWMARATKAEAELGELKRQQESRQGRVIDQPRQTINQVRQVLHNELGLTRKDLEVQAERFIVQKLDAYMEQLEPSGKLLQLVEQAFVRRYRCGGGSTPWSEFNTELVRAAHAAAAKFVAENVRIHPSK